MVEVKKKKNETFDALLRRFQRRFQSSGKQIESKRRRFHDGGQNNTQRHESALRRVTKGAEFAYLTKTGQLKEDPKKKKYGRR
jgi:ribosomal protein S21